ncbi:MAG: hypothetical protein E7642_05040 [Ruminococcaceae bacterium]|nr:hypothetical protein [Oscillospiraceae bacterium]
MKKIIALILIICICATLAFSFSSCEYEKEEEEGTTTETEELKELADPALIDRIKERMTRESISKLLGAKPIKYDGGRAADVYRFTDGRAAHLEYYNNDNETLMNIKVEKMVELALIDQIKEGYTYDKITEIFGGIKGKMTTSRYWGLYRYVLNDGRLLYIDYDEQAFATSIYIENEKGERTYPHLPQQESYSSKNADEFRQYLIDNYKDKASEIAVPVLVSDEFRLYAASDVSKCFFYTFVPAEADEHSDEFVKGLLSVEIWKIDLMYKDLVNYYKSEERNRENEVIECKDGVVFVKNWGRFIFNNNGRALVVDIPSTLREDFSYSEDYSGTPITSLEDLNKYITIEYFDLNSTENSSN